MLTYLEDFPLLAFTKEEENHKNVYIYVVFVH